MLVAVQESAANRGKGRHAGRGMPTARAATARFALPAITLGVWMAMGVPVKAVAQIVADPNAGAHRPTVGQTANGLPQVDITRPSAAGVSLINIRNSTSTSPAPFIPLASLAGRRWRTSTEFSYRRLSPLSAM
jgi:hypothetical protein